MNCYGRVMVFLRIENDERRGCYIGSPTLDSGVTPNHPMPDEDFLLRPQIRGGLSLFSGKYRFGFSTYNQLRAWFDDDKSLEALFNDGFQLSVYEVPFVFRGESQACIDEKHHKDEYMTERQSLLQFRSIPTKQVVCEN